MIIWSGLGFLVAVIAFGCSLLMELTVRAIFNDEHYYQKVGWPILVAFCVAAVIVWFLGKWLNAKQGKVLIDKESGREVVFKPNHALFFINMQYWGPIL